MSVNKSPSPHDPVVKMLTSKGAIVVETGTEGGARYWGLKCSKPNCRKIFSWELGDPVTRAHLTECHFCRQDVAKSYIVAGGQVISYDGEIPDVSYITDDVAGIVGGVSS